MKKKFKVRYIFITLGVILLIVIGIVMWETFIGKLILSTLGILFIVIGIVVLKKKGKFKLRYIFFALGIIITFLVVSNLIHLMIAGQVKNLTKSLISDLESTVNSLVDERLAEFYSNQNSYTPSKPDASGNSSASIPDVGNDFTDVSWPDDSNPDFSESTPSAEDVVTIANSETSNSTNWIFYDLVIYDSYDEAFYNATALPSGRYTIITVKSNSKVENIKATASMFNPDADDFEVYTDFSFKSSQNSNGEYRLNFKIPDNPYISSYNSGSKNFVAVFEIVTEEGTSYVSCAY